MAYALALLGLLVFLGGVWWIYPPLALIVGGLSAACLGVLLIDWKPKT